MKHKLYVAFAVMTLAFLVMCTSNYNEAIRKAETTFYKGDYLGAARSMLPQVNTTGRDQLLYMMEAGLMLHAGGDYKKSTAVFT
nr:hypothetical protein [Spirochaetota bacterium]